MNTNINILAEKLGNLLSKKNLKIVTAESCTAGGLAYAITLIPGSSQWFERGFVTYSNLAKQEMLGVSQEIIQNYGAVSAETVTAMAEGALKNSIADISIAITGIAGPDGGSIEKPVGLVWFGWTMKNNQAQKISELFQGDRNSIRQQAIQFALEKLIKILS